MKRRKKHRGILLLLILLLLAITGGVFIGTEIFQIKKITVLGSRNVVYNDIIQMSGILYDENIFKLDKELVRQKVEAHPYLDVVSIERQYPDGVIITVKERQAIAIIPYLNSYFVIDRKGNILEINNEMGEIYYPIVQDMPVRSFAMGKKIVVSEEYQLKSLCRVLESISALELQDEISEIKMTNPDDIYLILKNGMGARIGQAIEVDKKLLWLKSDEIKEACQGIIGGILDLRVASQPVFYPEEN